MPALLKISSEKTTVNRLKKDIKLLNLKLSELQALLEEKDGELCQLRSNCSSVAYASTERTRSSSSVVHEQNRLISKDTQETCPPDTFQIGEAEVDPDWVVAGNMRSRPEFSTSKSDPNLSSQSSPRVIVFSSSRMAPIMKMAGKAMYKTSLKLRLRLTSRRHFWATQVQ
ncbi:uncharacterized protein [Malus domestica]|uniref:uncharacterized protein n=1 Tax=Malus domestica TaxID=3750 RepID=UPI00397633FF